MIFVRAATTTGGTNLARRQYQNAHMSPIPLEPSNKMAEPSIQSMMILRTFGIIIGKAAFDKKNAA